MPYILAPGVIRPNLVLWSMTRLNSTYLPRRTARAVISVRDSMALRQDGEEGREERTACGLDKGEDFVCRLWAVRRASGLGHAFVLSIV